MFTQAELEAILSAGIALIILAISIDIYWILNGWQIEAIRRAFARLVWRWGAEGWVKGLRELVEDGDSRVGFTSDNQK